jgi:hypothetical protein
MVEHLCDVFFNRAYGGVLTHPNSGSDLNHGVTLFANVAGYVTLFTLVDLEREQRNFDEVQKEKRLVDEELAKTKTQLKEVLDELQQAYSKNERNLAEMPGFATGKLSVINSGVSCQRLRRL